MSVNIEGVGKRFRIYTEHNRTLKATVLRRRRSRYQEFWAVREVDLTVASGRTLGLVGGNGSGKSTLLKCLARIYAPDEGRVRVRGTVAALLELGAGFHPELSGRENVFLNAAILGMRERAVREQFDDIVSFAGLERFIDNPVATYSSGMYVRLGFAVATSVRPEVLLVDEVLAVGDQQFQRRCAERISELRRSGCTVVVVSHALDTVRALCDEVAWLDAGRLRQVGPPGEVLDAYLGASHDDRRPDSGAGARWGSGEGQVEHVELLDGSGRRTSVVRTGEPVVLRLHWTTTTKLERPVFGIGVHRVDGLHVTGPNTRLDNVVPAAIDGHGVADLVVPALPLLPGTYDVSASLYDYTLAHPYDYRQHILRFDVDPGGSAEQHGVITLGGRWRVTDSVAGQLAAS